MKRDKAKGKGKRDLERHRLRRDRDDRRDYRVLYSVTKPLLPLLKRILPVVTTEQFGRAMLNVARQGAPKRVLESSDINQVS